MHELTQLDKIKIPNRIRKNIGDLKDLKLSMKILGLLQPIGITKSYELIFGERRLKSAKELGWRAIDAIIIE